MFLLPFNQATTCKNINLKSGKICTLPTSHLTESTNFSIFLSTIKNFFALFFISGKESCIINVLCMWLQPESSSRVVTQFIHHQVTLLVGLQNLGLHGIEVMQFYLPIIESWKGMGGPLLLRTLLRKGPLISCNNMEECIVGCLQHFFFNLIFFLLGSYEMSTISTSRVVPHHFWGLYRLIFVCIKATEPLIHVVLL